MFTTDACPFCRMAKDFLDDHNIPFEEVNVAEDHAAAHEMVEKSGQMGVPVILVSDKKSKETVIIGFDAPKLKKALRIEE